MNIYAYGGPTYNNDNIKPFSFENADKDHLKHINGIPKLWNFKPFVFGEDNFDN